VRISALGRPPAVTLPLPASPGTNAPPPPMAKAPFATPAPRQRAIVVGVVLAVHLLAFGLLLARTVVAARPQPIVAFATILPPAAVQHEEQTKPPPTSHPVPRAPAVPRPSAPIAVLVETTTAAPTIAAPAVEAAPAPAAPIPAVAAPLAVVALPAPAAAPPRVLPASAIAYLVPPPIEMPLASRRLGESGTVLLRVCVGRDGAPQQITLHRTSGFERLDRQALEAMRHARFKPQTEDGQAIEWVVIAPFEYQLD
jgi:protein TonB